MNTCYICRATIIFFILPSIEILSTVVLNVR